MTASSDAPSSGNRITAIKASEIVDSCGRPAVQVRVALAGGATGRAGIPSVRPQAAGRRWNCAITTRTGYGGLGVLRAVESVNGEIADMLAKHDWPDLTFVTNPAIIAEAIGAGVANAALIKLNEIGTITETLEAMATCRAARPGVLRRVR